MNIEQKDAMKKGRAEAREKFDGQTIKLDADWIIRRADSLNWEIQYKGRFQGYYSHIIAAFRAIEGKMLDPEVKSSLQAIQESQKELYSRIASALYDAKKLVNTLNA